MQVTSKQGQWLGDIVIRESGSIESLMQAAVANNVSVAGKITVGSLISKPASLDRRVMNYYSTNGIYPATEMIGNIFGGIGYMGVELDFLIS